MKSKVQSPKFKVRGPAANEVCHGLSESSRQAVRLIQPARRTRFVLEDPGQGVAQRALAFIRSSALLFVLPLSVWPSAAPAQVPAPLPAAQPAIRSQVRFDQNLGATVPLDMRFVDDSGRDVALGEYFKGRPVVLALVYYQCPGLCTFVLTSMVQSLKAVPLQPGQDFQVVVVSIDPRERPLLAAAKKSNYLEEYGPTGTAAGWHFLTGREPAIRQLADVVGYHYAYDPVSGLYAHPAGIMVLTAEGKLSRTLFGATYEPRDLRLALVDAGQGRVGSPLDKIEAAFCFKYDPSTGKYTLAVMRIMGISSGLTVTAIALMLLVLIRRERRRRRAEGLGPGAKGLAEPGVLSQGPTP